MDTLKQLKHKTPHAGEWAIMERENTFLEPIANQIDTTPVHKELAAIAGIVRNSTAWKAFMHGVRAVIPHHDESLLKAATVWHLPEQRQIATSYLPTLIQTVDTWLEQCHSLTLDTEKSAEWAVATYVHPINWRTACQMAEIKLHNVFSKRKAIANLSSLRTSTPNRVTGVLPVYNTIPPFIDYRAIYTVTPDNLFSDAVLHLKAVEQKLTQYTQRYTSIAPPEHIRTLVGEDEISFDWASGNYLIMQKIPLLIQAYFDQLLDRTQTLANCFTDTVALNLLDEMGRKESYRSQIIRSWRPPHNSIKENDPTRYVKTWARAETWFDYGRGLIPSLLQHDMGEYTHTEKSSTGQLLTYGYKPKGAEKEFADYTRKLEETPNLKLAILIAEIEYIIAQYKLRPIHET